jgi:ribose transport system permease protein
MSDQPVTSGTSVETTSESTPFLPRLWSFFRNNIALLALIIVGVVFSITAPNFMTMQNLANIGRQTAVILIMGCGMTMVIVTGNIDLSVSSTLALAPMFTALIITTTGSILLGLVVGLATGLAVGWLNGILRTKGGIPSFLVTLGMMGIVRGIAMLVTGTRPIVIYEELYWRAFGDGDIFGFLPIAIFWTIVAIIVTGIAMRYTTLGRYMYATGGNEEAARFTGVRTHRVMITAFMISGLLAAFAGIVLSSRMHAARPITGEGMELNVIAAVILGGTSLFGGKGTILGTVLGALVIAALNNGLIIVGFGTHVQMVVRGIVIILAVLFAKEE